MWWFMSPEGQALTDAERFKGNPAPGSGTGPSRYLQEHNIAVRFAPQEYEQNDARYERKYLNALGLHDVGKRGDSRVLSTCQCPN